MPEAEPEPRQWRETALDVSAAGVGSIRICNKRTPAKVTRGR